MRRVRKFDRYVSSLNSSISVVNRAICEGALLTKQEELDYYFKRGLVGIKKRFNHSNPTEKLGYFYAEVFTEIYDLRAEGYSNKDVVELAKHICFSAWSKGLSEKFRVHSYDSNSILFLELYQGLKLVYTFEVHGLKSVTDSLLALTAYVGTRKIKDEEYADFAGMYLLNIHREIMSCKLPKPYTYTGAAKTLRYYLKRSNENSLDNTSKSGKIIDFRVG